MVTQNPSNVEISEGIFIHNHDNGTVNIHKHDNGTANRKEQNGMTGLQILHRWVSDGAAHDSVQHAPVCHPDTRKTIIGEIMSWIGDPSRTSSVLWFNGPAGSGKTAIAQSLCKRCAAIQWLGGSFFFSRHVHKRSKAEFLFPTISFELTNAIPDVGKIIDTVVANDLSIPTKALEIQLRKLILEPLQQVSEQSKQPIVIIIDGLDECEGEDVQSNLLQLLGSVFERLSVGGCDRICLIVTSRPEPWIRDGFAVKSLSRITRQIFLGQTPEANDDIRTFLRLRFAEIHDSPKHRDTMSTVTKPWPSYRVLDNLVDKSSGQFIYPDTVLKFVDDPNFRPTDRLDIIMSIPVISPSTLAQNPLAAIDQLYSQILSMSSDTQRTLDILSAHIAMQASASVLHKECKIFQIVSLGITEKLLGLQPGDGSQALRMIHSLVHITRRPLMWGDANINFPIPDIDLPIPEFYYQENYEIRFHHKSFIDYLMDPSRSLEYRIDMEKMNARLALTCIHIMQTFSLQSAPSRIACITWGYATLCWTGLVTESGIPRETALQALQLMSFDLFACYLDTLGAGNVEPESICRNTIKRVAFSSWPVNGTAISKIAKNLLLKKDETRPNSFDIMIAREFLHSIGAENDFFTIFKYSRAINKVVEWMQRNPDFPPELLRHFQIVDNVLSHYSVSWNPSTAIRSDRYFRNAHKAPGFSIVNIWTDVIKLLKRRT